MAPYSDCAEIQGLRQLSQTFCEKREDFFREGRKFHLAVLGQVKAGKSSFLNTLLFDGEQVLPRAATPKTSALTRIEYAPQNQLKVEYVTPEEWTALRRLASSPMQTPQVRAAREAVELARERGTPVQDCLAAKSETFSFSSYAELNRKLDESVGDTGILTPIVKYVTLGLSLERLENLSVIDTPGLNDPVYSRTEKNRRFIELCDAAFFLSRCGSFLDQNDLALLTMYLPGKGLGSLTLIASQEVLMINTAAAETVFFFDRTSKSLSPVYYSAAKRLHIMYGSFGCPLFCWYVQSASHLADSSPAQ